MSDVLNLKLKSKRMDITFYNPLESNVLEIEKDENYFKRQLDSQYEKGFSEAEILTREKLEEEYLVKIKEKQVEIKKKKQLLDKIIPEYERSFEEAVINLSMLVAEKIVQREILKEDIIGDVLKDAIKKVLGANNVIVKLNPDDFKALESGGDESFSIKSFDKIKFEQDDRIEPGGCFIETEIGSVDARISSQCNEIRKQLEANI
ncbi:MAG TPA: hypothetical protein ENI57_09010 [Ignavibacteria bacterium]|nr:hypothetical protein [Ignavibacteria bacterium]